MSYSHAYSAPNLSEWSLDDSSKRYRKEVIYEGPFLLQNSSGKRFNAVVDDAQLHQWVKTFDAMKNAGVSVPVPLTHTEDPEKNRGTVVQLEVAKNKDNKNALFAHIEFRDKEAAKLAVNTDVSIYVPPEFTDGKGVVYHRPVRHIALTNYPVIPKLGKFEAIAASFIGEEDMALADLAKKLGVSIEDGMKDSAIESAVVSLFASLKKKNVVKEPKTISAGFLKMGKENRETKLKALVLSGKIVPAVSKKLEAVFCTDESLSLSLQDEVIDDGFDAIMDALADNENVLSFKENTPPQTLVLGKDGKSKVSPLVADAEKRSA